MVAFTVSIDSILLCEMIRFAAAACCLNSLFNWNNEKFRRLFKANLKTFSMFQLWISQLEVEKRYYFCCRFRDTRLLFSLARTIFVVTVSHWVSIRVQRSTRTWVFLSFFSSLLFTQSLLFRWFVAQYARIFVMLTQMNLEHYPFSPTNAYKHAQHNKHKHTHTQRQEILNQTTCANDIFVSVRKTKIQRKKNKTLFFSLSFGIRFVFQPTIEYVCCCCLFVAWNRFSPNDTLYDSSPCICI